VPPPEPSPPPEPIPPPGPHGGDGAAVARAIGRDDLLDLSMTANPDAPDIAALAARHLDALRRYPDPIPARAVLAGALGVPVERVLLTNGGAEAIALVCDDLRRAAVRDPEFSLYARHLATVVDPDDDPSAPLIRSNPHNPTGRLAAATERAAVWDEAFYPLATGTWTRGDHDTIVVGSLTKTFACAGLRAGYVVAPPTQIDRLARRQPRWSVNTLALALIPDLIARADLAGWRDATAARRAALTAALPGVHASDAPYVLVDAPEGATRLRARLARHGVLVRDCTNFGLARHVRIAVPDDAGRRRLVDAWRP
jgi:histidinol-phosphate/aromatic aminotransferase/cobyric acid decarboxylase-like protein